MSLRHDSEAISTEVHCSVAVVMLKQIQGFAEYIAVDWSRLAMVPKVDWKAICMRNNHK